ncbi:methylaspartate mutase [Actinoplanes sp. N902-109]|uniref:methylaspartate mutase n=1 Tax=Actinoplanes sp. (strain N902-109) TaxID=649831 RepID=UPI00059F3314|nr:methylaspartate mutase [Actinoplanes sp. N902-109]
MASFVARAAAEGRLVVQPRMGFGTVAQMRAGLEAVRGCRARAVGTVTLDSYTRVGDHESARRSLARGADLNGFPIVAHGAAVTRAMLDGIQDDDFPVQVRHGSALPYDIFRSVLDAGADATEGGPVSYCLPYSRVPLREAVSDWSRSAELLAAAAADGHVVHLETFGGCMLGQLCPPGLLVALSVLEGLFFRQRGVPSVSLSYAQQTSLEQDVLAVTALRRLGDELLSDIDRHTVVYTYMGVFPRTPVGAYRTLEESVRLARLGGAERLIVKTPAEAHRIPTITENVEALEFADAVAALEGPRFPADPGGSDNEVYAEARRLVDATLALSDDVGTALLRAFRAGLLDVPYCLHADNANAARATIDHRGFLQWAEAGRMPVVAVGRGHGSGNAQHLLEMLSYNERRFDRELLPAMRTEVTA